MHEHNNFTYKCKSQIYIEEDKEHKLFNLWLKMDQNALTYGSLYRSLTYNNAKGSRDLDAIFISQNTKELTISVSNFYISCD